MRQTKKGNEWHFGMKAHTGVDADTGPVHSMTTTAANVHGLTQAHRLRARVEHPFLKAKRLFGYAKAHYRGLAKNGQRLALLMGLGNLYVSIGEINTTIL